MSKLVEVIPGWATSDAVADYLGVSRQHVARIREKLGGVPVGKNTLLYPAGQVREFKKLPPPKVGWKRGRPRGPKS